MEVTAFTVGKHLSDLVGRHVAVQLNDKASFAPETRVACYTVEPSKGTAVVQLDFHLLAMLSGAMIGVPNAQVEAQVRNGELDENLTDASGEVMNVLSAVIVSEGRAIFKGLFKKIGEYGGQAEVLLRGNRFPLKLTVTPTGAKPGSLLIISDVM